MENNINDVILYFKDTTHIVNTISVKDIDAAIELLFRAWKNGNTIFVAGNGGSASTATHFASDLAKFCSVKGKPRFRAIALTDNIPLMTAIINDEGWSEVFTWQLKNLMHVGDVFVAISVHGGSGKDRAGLWSQNLLAAIAHTQYKSGKVLGLSGCDGGALKQMSNVCIVVPSNSTPQVEGMHSVICHLIAERLRKMVEDD